MLTTIKLPITTDITEYQRQYTNIVHYAYNRFQDNKELTWNDVEWLVKDNMNNIHLMDSWFIRCAVKEAEAIQQDNVIFGGKNNWHRYNKSLISKEEYKKNKLRDVYIIGEKDKDGNRKFKLDIANNQILFKPKRGICIPVKLPKTKHCKTLEKLQTLCELGDTLFHVRLDGNSISISYETELFKKKKHKVINNRILSIDLNPNYTAFAICDYSKTSRKNIIYKEIICLKELYKQSKNKIWHELYQINKYIINLAKHYKCESIVVEKLNIESSEKGKGKRYNQQCNNDWRRKKVLSNLTKHCIINNIHFIEVIPQYSSFIGQIDNPEEYDSIAAALELGRRGNLYIRKYIHGENLDVKGCIIKVYEDLSLDLVDRWKKILDFPGKLSSYLDLYNLIKKLKYSYRNLFPFDYGFSLSLFSCESRVYRFV